MWSGVKSSAHEAEWGECKCLGDLNVPWRPLTAAGTPYTLIISYAAAEQLAGCLLKAARFLSTLYSTHGGECIIFKSSSSR